jgi:uncharacterized membrane protein required for colicin V production
VATVDWIALAVVAVSALAGLRKGLVTSALSLAGLAGGAFAGSRIAPSLLSGGSSSRWAAMVSLVGAIAGAALGQTVAAIVGSFVRGGLKLTPLRLLDSVGGIFFGAATGLVFVWVLGATALLVPGQTTLRKDVQRSAIIRRLNETVPPRQLLHLLARIDPFPSIAGPAAPTEPPSPTIALRPAVRNAELSVVKITGTACGVGVEGSGWFATRDLVVTAAHVVAGEHDTTVQIPRYPGSYSAQVTVFDPRNDVAVLQVVGADPAVPLRIADPRPGASVAILGYPENGPLTATPGRIGRTAVVITQDAYGHGPVARTITAVAGQVEHGDSGGPAVDSSGSVEATIFAARLDSTSGFGIPSSIVRHALDSAHGPVSTGSCAG